MRSSKSRSRNKSNRNRSVGNITNRVFESSGPEGKVRGTPAQIIEKYNQLARDAQLANDRVAAENFRQHAEHYTRLLSEAQREIEARREQQEALQRQQRENARAARETRSDGRADQRSRSAQQSAAADPLAVTDPATEPQPDVIGVSPLVDDGALVVDTPESRPKRGRKPRGRKPALPSQEEGASGSAQGESGTDKAADKAADKPAEKSGAPEAAE